MAWQDIPNNPLWQYDDAPLDPGGAETALWETSTNGVRISASGDEIYVNCRHIPLHPTQDSFPNEINKTFWAATDAFPNLDNYIQPDGLYIYHRPDTTSIYIKPE
jgi:hypothetical protein